MKTQIEEELEQLATKQMKRRQMLYERCLPIQVESFQTASRFMKKEEKAGRISDVTIADDGKHWLVYVEKIILKKLLGIK